MDSHTVTFTAELFGPLDSHKKYIEHIALANVVEYLSLKRAHAEEKRTSSSDKYRELRYFLNAVESVNNIPEYLYFDKHSTRANPLPEQFRSQLLDSHPCLKRLADIANAYKHCVRGRSDKKKNDFSEMQDVDHARDLTKSPLTGSVNIEPDGTARIEMQYEFIPPNEEETLEEGFRFWVEYLNGERQIDVATFAQPPLG
jgi:hypothetical protein